MAGRSQHRTWGISAAGHDSDWRNDAACRDEDSELFFPTGSTGPALLQVEAAKAICRRCPALDTCLKWALDTRQEYGVWGGMSEQERRTHLRNLPLAERFPPVGELERELERPVPQMGYCQGCGARYLPTMKRQRLCRPCGRNHPDRTIRRRYTEAVAC